jgi:L-ascorbate metabolism protein UlaG (beta-lactamase superfamily)
MTGNLSLRWLGAAGIELRAGSHTLLVDPYVTRVSLRQMLFGKLKPDAGLIGALLPRADIILVSHAHFDHLLDVPTLAARSGAQVFGSANTCQILKACEVAQEQIHQVQAGAHLDLGVFQVDVYPAAHESVLGSVPYEGAVWSHIRPPLRAADYRFDKAFMYRIQMGERSWLFTGSAGPAPDARADVVLLGSTGRPAFYQAILDQTKPGAAVLIHWDNFWRPLAQPLRPISYAPVKAVNPHALAQQLRELAPELRVFIPEALREYSSEQFYGVPAERGP